MLAMLYLGEGAKYNSHSGLTLGSSDPGIIRLFIRLLQDCYSKSLDELRCWICHRADQDINNLKRFWSGVTGIQPVHFYKSTPDPRSIGKKTIKSNYRGVCVVSCLKSTKIQLELGAIADMIIENI